jgi:methylaspartate mutase epsilon subunit
LKTLTRDYLQMFGFESMQSYLVYHQWMGRFPPQRAKAAALIASSSVIGSMISADKIVVKTVDEALGIPDWSTNVDAVDMVKYICRTFPCPQPLTSPLIEREIALIESETRSILQTIFSMLGDVFWHSVLQAFQFGFVDIPFSPHADNANKLISMRDGNGSIRICDRGNVPICDEDVEQERVLLQSRLASNGDSEQMYERLLSDINIMV